MYAAWRTTGNPVVFLTQIVWSDKKLLPAFSGENATSLPEGGSKLFAAKQIDAHLVFECNRSVYWIGESGDYSSLPHEGGGMTKS